MAHKYLVDLTDKAQGYLINVIRKGKTTAPGCPCPRFAAGGGGGCR